MLIRSKHAYSEYKDHPNHFFLNFGRPPASDDDDWRAYLVAGKKYVHYTSEDSDFTGVALLFESLMEVLPNIVVLPDGVPKFKKVEAAFKLKKTECVIGLLPDRTRSAVFTPHLGPTLSVTLP